jgi:hypothetical protein
MRYEIEGGAGKLGREPKNNITGVGGGRGVV